MAVAVVAAVAAAVVVAGDGMKSVDVANIGLGSLQRWRGSSWGNNFYFVHMNFDKR